MKTISTRRMPAIIFAGVAMTLSVPVFASPAERPAPRNTEAPTNATMPAANRPATRYCIREALTGSHIREKICKTRSEWMNQGFDPLAK